MRLLVCLGLLVCFTACSRPQRKVPGTASAPQTRSADSVPDGVSAEAKGNTAELSCKPLPPRLQERKARLLESLKKQIVARKELENGYAFRFRGTDSLVDELAEFVKTERQCCDFFTFNLSFGQKDGDAWLELKGPEGAKEFITDELGL